jgi:hypothetical protein
VGRRIVEAVELFVADARRAKIVDEVNRSAACQTCPSATRCRFK